MYTMFPFSLFCELLIIVSVSQQKVVPELFLSIKEDLYKLSPIYVYSHVYIHIHI